MILSHFNSHILNSFIYHQTKLIIFLLFQLIGSPQNVIFLGPIQTCIFSMNLFKLIAVELDGGAKMLLPCLHQQLISKYWALHIQNFKVHTLSNYMNKYILYKPFFSRCSGFRSILRGSNQSQDLSFGRRAWLGNGYWQRIIKIRQVSTLVGVFLSCVGFF